MTTVDDRIAQRRADVRADRRRRRLRRTLAVVVVLAVVGLLALVERSWLVGLAEVQVEGTRRLTVEEVIEASGLELGTSTLRLSLGGAQEGVEALPLVRSAEVQRVGAVRVRISVVERAPVLVARVAGSSALLDDQGVVIAAGAERGLPLLDLLDRSSLPEPGARVDGSASLAAGHAVFVGLSGPVRAEVVRVEVRGPDDVDLLLTGGLRVRIGRPTQLDEKVRTLGALLEELPGEDVAVVDVRVPSNPVVSSLDRSG